VLVMMGELWLDVAICEGWVVDEPNIRFKFEFTIGTSGAIMIETKQDKN